MKFLRQLGIRPEVAKYRIPERRDREPLLTDKVVRYTDNVVAKLVWVSLDASFDSEVLQYADSAVVERIIDVDEDARYHYTSPFMPVMERKRL